MSGMAKKNGILNIKKRDADYCNLKLLLLFTVVFGHMIEGRIADYEVLMQIYRVIYSVHMPLFLFLSGLFLKDRTSCLQQVKQSGSWYLFCQLLIVIIGRLFGARYSILTPFWHLWYLLSLASMSLLGAVWFYVSYKYPKINSVWVKAAIVAGTILIACLIGKCAAIGRMLSLSRTICFLPYFLMGLFLPKEIDWKRLRPLGGIALCGYLVLFLLWGQHISVGFFYQADAYRETWGFFTRLLCYALGITLGLFLLTFMAEKRFFFTKLGADTLGIYLLHAPLVKLCGLIRVPESVWVIMTPFLSVYIILFLHKVFLWQHPMCAVLNKKATLQGIAK